MKVRLAPAMIAGAAILAVAAPANAAAPPPTKLYFHCIAPPSKVENASIVAGSFSGAAPNWDKNAPTASFTTGAGCGFADAGALEGTALANIYDGVFGGAYGGAIDKMVVELHSLFVSRARQGDSAALHVRVGLDGEMVTERDVTVTPTASDTGASELFKFEITDLGIEAGDASRIVNLTVNADANGLAGWVYDAAEVPSNVTLYAPPTTTTATATKAKAAAKRRALARKRAHR